MTGAGFLIGVAAAGGVWLLVRAMRPAPLSRRVLPLTSGPLGSRVSEPGGRPGELVGRLIGPLRELLDGLFGAHNARARLVQAGLDESVEGFRLRQLRWAVVGMAGAVAFGLIRIVTAGPLPPGAWIALTLVSGLGGACAAEQSLVRRATKRRQRIAVELPTVAEMLAFTVSAGLSPGAALSRVAARSRGELGRELRRCCDEVSAGVPLAEAVRQVGTRTAVPGVARLADSFVIALERGTPLAEVLRAQAMDARASGHRELMESAGRREVTALVPVVFLILPVVVVIAVFPGIQALTVNVP